MLIPKDKINAAKAKYGERAIQEIMEYFGEGSYISGKKAYSCPYHIDKTPSFVWNEKNSSMHCFSCGRNFDIIDLYIAQGMTYLKAIEKLFDNVDEEFTFGNTYSYKDDNYRYPKREKEDRTNVEEYLALRKLSAKTLDYLDIQSDKSGNIVFHFYDENDILKTVKYRVGHVFNKDKDKNKCWAQKNADFAPILFNMNRVDPSKPLVISEGELDCASIVEAGYSNVVSVPNGCNNAQWIEYNWDWLEQFDKIILWFDSDAPGKKARDNIMHRLGTWRTYYVEIMDKDTTESGRPIKDANEILYYKGANRVLDYIAKPLDVPIDNVLDLATAEEFDIEKTEGLYTGIKDLDDKIYKLVFGTLNIITGKSGSGKSVFVNQVAICQALNQGYDVFVFSGELPSPVLRNWVEVNMIGRDYITMKDNHIRVLDSEKRRLMQNWYSGRILVYNNDVDTTAKSILIKMEELARKCGTKVFLIDNLMMVDLECQENERLQAEKRFVSELIFFAKKFNVLVFLVAHPRKTMETRLTKEDIAGSGNIVNLAHMVFSVHRYTDKEKEGEMNLRGQYVKGKEPIEYDTCIEVLKNRITGVLPMTKLYFDYNSYRFYRTPSELWFRYGWNKSTEPLNTNDPNPHGISSGGDSPL